MTQRYSEEQSSHKFKLALFQTFNSFFSNVVGDVLGHPLDTIRVSSTGTFMCAGSQANRSLEQVFVDADARTLPAGGSAGFFQGLHGASCRQNTHPDCVSLELD